LLVLSGIGEAQEAGYREPGNKPSGSVKCR